MAGNDIPSPPAGQVRSRKILDIQVYTAYIIRQPVIWSGVRLLQKLKIQIDNHLTLREKIVETVRNAIVNGQIAAGARVAEPDLADHFGISRTPIREAFRQLESEGFITVIPRKGAIVASLSAKDISDFYDLKMVLEGYAARCATKVLTEKEMAKIEGSIRQHWEIIAAFRKRNADMAESLVIKNAQYGKKVLLRELAKG